MKMHDILEEMTAINPTILKYLNERLIEWSEWSLEPDKHGLGFSSVAIEYKVWKEGCLPHIAFAPKPLSVNESAEEIEDIILIMTKQGKQGMHYAMALRAYYVGRYHGNHHRAARSLGICDRQYHNHFKGAYLWLAGWFTGYCATHLLACQHEKE